MRDSYLSRHTLVDTDVVAMLGDFAYERGTDAEFQAKYFGMYPTVTRSLPVWPVFGNHDGQSANSNSQTGPYYNIFSPPRAGQHGGVASGTEAYYSFDYGSVHFCVLNSFDVSRYASGVVFVHQLMVCMWTAVRAIGHYGVIALSCVSGPLREPC